MTMRTIITTRFTVTKGHYPHVLTPYRDPTDKERYSIRVPGEAFPNCKSSDKGDGLGFMLNCNSVVKPMIVPGEGTSVDRLKWSHLVEQAREWNYPVDWLLLDREIIVAGFEWQSNSPFTSGTYAGLEGVKIGGRLDEDEGLATHIIERKGWFQ